MKDFQDIDATLEDWNALRNSIAFDAILIGNGASRTVWEDFAYDSLFENARTVEEKPLSAPENSSSFSVSVVLPASGWEMMANVRRR